MQTGFFEILAECSIALAGFGAVHAVLQGSGGPRGIFRAWFVVSQGTIAFTLCMLVLLLEVASLSADMLWPVASLLGALIVGGPVYAMFRMDSKMTQLGFSPQATLNRRTAQLSFVVAFLLLLINFIEWPWHSGPLSYAIAVTFILTSGLLALLHSFFVPLQQVLAGSDDESQEDRPVA